MADTPAHDAPASLDLYWIPLGADTPVVATSGRIYERVHARLQRRPPCDLYHAALVAELGGRRITIESAPVPDAEGRDRRGVVAEGAVGSRPLGRFRVFRYEVRRWDDGVIPDLGHAVASPVRITEDAGGVRRVLDHLGGVPSFVWGRDERDLGEMWNSNSVVAWVLSRAGLVDAAGAPPPGGRAPGWDAGCRLAERDGTARWAAERRVRPGSAGPLG